MQISAFVDGELPGNEAELLLRRMSQDAQLRAQVAEYLEIGRAMRGEASFAGMDSLRDRVVAELDDRAPEVVELSETADKPRSWRPFAGVAVAATVAVAGIFALRQTGVEQPDAATMIADQVVEAVEGDSYTVPQNQDILRQYLMSHGEETSNLGDNGINARWVSLEFSQDVVEEPAETADTDEDTELQGE
jgi:negative regulator of sigma E activity